jgi:hypothetical protein
VAGLVDLTGTFILCEKTMMEPQDVKLLAQLDSKMAIVRDRTRSVALGYTTGFFLYGDGGVGKSFAVLSELERLQADFKLHNSRMTGRGLFDALYDFPESIHVLEDMEAIFDDRMAQGVLRSALWGQVKDDCPVRVVTWRSHKTDLRCHFEGGVIIISNRPLADLPELNAIATRINPTQLHVSNEEAAALMREIAAKGYRRGGQQLLPGACTEVAEYLIETSLNANRRLDLRLLVNSFSDRLQWEKGDTEAHWKELVTSRLDERVVAAKRSRAAEIADEREMARRIKDLPRSKRAAEWENLTGKSEKALYRRLAEI